MRADIGQRRSDFSACTSANAENSRLGKLPKIPLCGQSGPMRIRRTLRIFARQTADQVATQGYASPKVVVQFGQVLGKRFQPYATSLQSASICCKRQLRIPSSFERGFDVLKHVLNTPKVELITPKVEANAANGTQNGLLVPRSRRAVGAY